MKIYKGNYKGKCPCCNEVCDGLEKRNETFLQEFKRGFHFTSLRSCFLKKAKDLGVCSNCKEILLQCPYCKTWQQVNTTSVVQQCDECAENFSME